jgi:hypothetical protein
MQDMQDDLVGTSTWWSYATIPETPYPPIFAYPPPHYMWPAYGQPSLRPWRRFVRRRRRGFRPFRPFRRAFVGAAFSELPPEERAKVDEFIEMWPEVSKEFLVGMPSPTKLSLIAAAAAAGLGFLLKKNPAKWGLVAGGTTFGAALVAEIAFAAGAGAGALVCMQEGTALPAHHAHRVGAGPAAPNSDYSFTRRPGFNDKNY